MKEYKQPKTRIKVVEDGGGVKYYAQYHWVLVPYIIQEWVDIGEHFYDKDYVGTLYEAKLRVDEFLERDHHGWVSHVEDKTKKKVKKKVQYIDYP